ncbi:nucleotide disphospho-sugar-binding domain-containing protein [Dactylosporangium sp. CA-152071]|uniref:nucleotide disphospho-sugar-binding domain-containing protein n=1 Tax=Dactylosporangium sp. CA-152071 TaxID=3239933 RepID=UPI003D91CEED
MRVLFTIYPNSLAHLYGAVPLAWALQSAGHEVRIAAHHSSAEQIMTTGLTPVALGDPDGPPIRLTDDGDPPRDSFEVDHYARIMGLTGKERERWITFYQYLTVPLSDYVRIERQEASDLVDFARSWRPDLVLWDVTTPYAAVAARACGAAHARLANGEDVLSFSLLRLAEYTKELEAAGLDPDPLATMLRPLADRYGMEVDDEMRYGQWTVNAMPEGLSLPSPLTRIHMRHIPYAGAEVFPKWLYEKPERPRVAMSLGESTRRFIVGDWDRTPTIMKALEGLDVDVIATLNDVQLDGVEKVPDNVRTIDWVNLTHLMPTCSALIHHGGIGTFSAAAMAGVPQLVCDIADESLLLKLVEQEPGTLTPGSYHQGIELGIREETVSAPAVQWEMPAKKLEAGPVSDYIISKHAGARLDHRALSIEEMRELILRVATEDSYRKGAAAVYEQWRATPSPSDIVPVLERMTADYRTGGNLALRGARSLAASLDRHRKEIDEVLTVLHGR